MKKTVAFLIFGAMISLLPLHAEQGKGNFIQLKEKVEGMKYGVFVDEECQKPFVNEEHEIILESDKDGKIELPHTEETQLYIKQIETVIGYFMDPSVYELNHELLELDAYPICMDIQIDPCKELKFQVHDEECEELLWVVDFATGKNMDMFEAGKTYLLKKEKQEEWTVCEDFLLEIPQYKEEILVNPEITVYGKVKFVFDNEKDMRSGKFQLFKDEEGNEQALDINGMPMILDLSDNYDDSFLVKKEKLFLKEIQTADSFYFRQEKPQEVLTELCQETIVTVERSLSKWTCILKDKNTGKQITGNIAVKDENGLKQQIHSGEEILLFPGKNYNFDASEVASGYYQNSIDNWKVPEYKPEETVIPILCDRFSLQINIEDSDSGKKLNGGSFAVYNKDNHKISEFTPESKAYEISHLKAGERYKIHQVRQIESYLYCEDQFVDIPEKGNTSIVLTVKMTGYTTLQAGIWDENTGMIVKEGTVSVYMDKSCTKEASDAFNQEKILADGMKEVHLLDGTYYIRMNTISSNWYRNDIVQAVHIDHNVSKSEKLTIPTEKINLKFQVVDSNNEKLNCFEVKITDENNNTVGVVNLLQCSSTIKAGISLNAETAYYYQLSHVDGQYEYEKEKIPFVLSQSYMEKGKIIQHEAVPYVTVSLMKTNLSTQAVYEIYNDKECRKKEEPSQNTEEIKKWNLKDGEYYLLQKSIHKSFYAQEKPEKIRIDHTKEWKKAIIKEEIPVTYMIRSVDEKNQFLAGSRYEIYDDTNHFVERVHTFNEELILSGTWLETGKTYTLKEIMTPDGYQKSIDMSFHVPVRYNGSIPVTTIEHKRKKILSLPSIADRKKRQPEVSNKVPEKAKKEEYKEEKSETKWWYAGAVGVFVLGGFITLKKKGNR